MNITWTRSGEFAANMRLKECYCMKVNGASKGAVYLKDDGKWHLFFWRFRAHSWDTLEEAKATCVALYRMGHYDQWNMNN